MATVLPLDSVVFTDTSTENIGYAKEFWRTIDGNFEDKSSLVVFGVDHRLHTASRSNKTTTTSEEKTDKDDEQRGLASNKNEASRRLNFEEEKYVQEILDHKTRQQDLLKKRRDERAAKESIRERNKETFADELSTFDVDDDKKEIEDEGLQAMKDIDNFERMIKMTNERRKEKR